MLALFRADFEELRGTIGILWMAFALRVVGQKVYTCFQDVPSVGNEQGSNETVRIFN